MNKTKYTGDLVDGIRVEPSTGEVTIAQLATADTTKFVQTDVNGKLILGTPAGGGSGGRFGIEDNLGLQNRAVDMQSFDFAINNIGYYGILSNTGNSLFSSVEANANFAHLFTKNSAISPTQRSEIITFNGSDLDNTGLLVAPNFDTFFEGQAGTAAYLISTNDNYLQYSRIGITPYKIKVQQNDNGPISTQTFAKPGAGDYYIPLSVSVNGGSPSYADNTGDIPIVILGDGVSLLADNGLHVDGGTASVYLGGSLLEDTSIDVVGYGIQWNIGDNYVLFHDDPSFPYWETYFTQPGSDNQVRTDFYQDYGQFTLTNFYVVDTDTLTNSISLDSINNVELRSVTPAGEDRMLRVRPESITIERVGAGQDGVEHEIPVSVNGNFADSTGNIDITVGGGGSSTRFGFSGEDDSAGEDRAFDTNTHSVAIFTSEASSIPFKVNSTNNIAAQFSSLYGIAVQGTTTGTFPAGHFTNTTPYTDTVISALHVQHKADDNTPILGIGVEISMVVSDDTDLYKSNALISRWTDLTHATRRSEFSIMGLDNGAEQEIFKMSGTGQQILPLYGSGTFTGTGVYNLQVDSSGNVIEGALGGGTANHIASQTYVRSVSASSTATIGNITWDNTINNQPIKVEFSGYWAATSATTNYSFNCDFNIGANSYGMTFTINSGTAQQGPFRISFSFNPSATGSSYGSWESIWSRDDGFTGFNLVQYHELGSSNYATRADLGNSQAVVAYTPAGLSLDNCMVVVTIADPSL